MSPHTFWGLWTAGLYTCSGLGALVLASAMSSRVLRIGLALVAAVWLATAGASLIEIAPDCDAIPWWLWWWAGCGFLP